MYVGEDPFVLFHHTTGCEIPIDAETIGILAILARLSAAGTQTLQPDLEIVQSRVSDVQLKKRDWSTLS
jgi:hypothetical protein